MRIKTLIIEDELDGAIVLKEMCKRFSSEINIIKHCTSLQEAIVYLKRNNVDLVFLDIHLGEVNGFDLFNHFPNPNFQIVFTTAYTSYAIDAFKTKAVDYLLKPIDIDDLQRAVRRVKEKMESSYLKNKLKNITQKQTIKINTNEGVQMVLHKNIIRCEAQGSYTLIYLNDYKKLMVSKNLKYMEEKLYEHSFVRTHRSHLINRERIIQIKFGKLPHLLLENNEKIPISKKYKKELANLL